MCLRVDSQGRCVHQATTCRESGAVDHQQVAAGVESSSMPYRDSFRTVAEQGNAPMRLDPRTHRVQHVKRPWQTSHVSAALAASEGCQYCLPHVGYESCKPSHCGVLHQWSLASISPSRSLRLSRYQPRRAAEGDLLCHENSRRERASATRRR